MNKVSCLLILTNALMVTNLTPAALPAEKSKVVEDVLKIPAEVQAVLHAVNPQAYASAPDNTQPISIMQEIEMVVQVVEEIISIVALL